VLERLSSVERVVFVLRNAFDFTFAEIAPVVGRNAAACRQIFGRARERVRKERPRFAVDREQHRALLRSFMEATRSGDTAKLVALLDEDAMLHGDGGGKALATKKPVVGSLAIARFLVAVARTLPGGVAVEERTLNGAPGLVFLADGRPILAVLIDTDGKRIRSVFAVANPDKLRGISLAAARPL
jgi:RNA polymerase sigma-70 factor (ECF subfamily)